MLSVVLILLSKYLLLHSCLVDYFAIFTIETAFYSFLYGHLRANPEELIFSMSYQRFQNFWDWNQDDSLFLTVNCQIIYWKTNKAKNKIYIWNKTRTAAENNSNLNDIII